MAQRLSKKRQLEIAMKNDVSKKTPNMNQNDSEKNNH